MVAALLAAHVAATWWSQSRESVTFDEVQHLGAAYAALTRDDYRLAPVAAPLAKWIAARSMATLEPRLAVDDPAYAAGGAWRVGCRLVNDHPRELLTRARLPFVALSALLGLIVFAWARELGGSHAGLAALCLYAASSEFLAHAHYANLDLLMALSTTLFLWSVARWSRRPDARRGVVVAVSFALAVIAKYSFPALVPMAMVIAVPGFLAARRDHAGTRYAVSALLVAEASAVAAFIAIWIAFGLRAPASPSPELQQEWRLEDIVAATSPMRSWFLTWRDRGLLPEAFLNGIAYTNYIPRTTHMAYLAGRVAVGGWWYYFPAAFVLKTPLPLMALVLLATLAAARRRRGDVLAVAVAALVYGVIAMSFRVSIGYRHLLPVLPPLLVIAGWGGGLLWEASRRGKFAVASLLAFYGLGTLRVAPHFLSYFNELAGGASGGSRYLVDSNCDWGQDLEELGRVARREGITHLKLAYFGSGDPSALGLEVEALPSVAFCWKPPGFATTVAVGDVVAVSVTNLRGVYYRLPGAKPFLLDASLPGLVGATPIEEVLAFVDRHYRPVATAGYSIRLYRLTAEHRRE